MMGDIRIMDFFERGGISRIPDEGMEWDTMLAGQRVGT